MSLIFRWEPPLYSSEKSAQICDVLGHRLLVKRHHKGARNFTCLIDGKDLRWLCSSIEKAKKEAEKHFCQFYMED